MKYLRRQAIKGIGGTLALSLLSKSTHALQEDRTAKPRIRIGQIGVGHAHANKLSVYRNSSDYEVVGIVEPNAELRKQAEVQEPFRDLPRMTQEELLNAPRLQAVLVETHVRNLLNVAETCVAAGKHVHVDVKGYQDITFPKYVRYVDDAVDIAKIIRGEKESDFSPDHDLAVQTSLLKACGL